MLADSLSLPIALAVSPCEKTALLDQNGNLKSKIDMRNPGLEPGSLAALEPESSASANSASSAGTQTYRQFLIIA